MTKTKTYRQTRFDVHVVEEARTRIIEIATANGKKIASEYLTVELTETSWQHDTLDEFYADLRNSPDKALLSIDGEGYGLSVYYYYYTATITVKAPSRANVEQVFAVFENACKSSTFEPPPDAVNSSAASPMIFVGHGHSSQWRDLKDHLQDKHGYKVQAYESGARAGHAIRDIVEELAKSASFALLVYTADDEQSDGSFRARQNVVHETGLFQGKLGFTRAIVVLEEGVNEFSNIAGVHQIRFSKGNIKETFGEVLATIRREFGPT